MDVVSHSTGGVQFWIEYIHHSDGNYLDEIVREFGYDDLDQSEA
jgi:hypothetical protein